MRNKTLYINKVVLGLAVSLLLGSCAKLAVETEQAISMSVKLPGATKSVVTDLDAFKTQGSFGVFGYKLQGGEDGQRPVPSNSEGGDTGYQIFTNEDVHYSDSKWTYDPLKYWDQKEFMWYSFMAYAPHSDLSHSGFSASWSDISASGTVSTVNYYALNLSGIPSWQKAYPLYEGQDADDIMVSDLASDEGRDYVGSADCTVNLSFHHILSLIDLTAYTIEGAFFEIVSVEAGSRSNTAKNVLINSNNAYSKPMITSGEYKENSTYSPYTASTADIDKGIATWYPSTEEKLKIKSFDESTPTLICQVLAFPFQVSGGLNLIINFTRSEGGPTEEKEIEISGLEDFKGDSHYSIKLKFEGGDIVDVTVSEVQNWNIVTNNHGVFNW